jgi:sentrin-specific protease 7
MQPNYTDCGVYLLGYLQKFYNDPREFVTRILTREMDREKDWPDMSAPSLRSRLRTILMDLAKQQEEEKRKAMKLKKKQSSKTHPSPETRKAPVDKKEPGPETKRSPEGKTEPGEETKKLPEDKAERGPDSLKEPPALLLPTQLTPSKLSDSPRVTTPANKATVGKSPGKTSPRVVVRTTVQEQKSPITKRSARHPQDEDKQHDSSSLVFKNQKSDTAPHTAGPVMSHARAKISPRENHQSPHAGRVDAPGSTALKPPSRKALMPSVDSRKTSPIRGSSTAPIELDDSQDTILHETAKEPESAKSARHTDRSAVYPKKVPIRTSPSPPSPDRRRSIPDYGNLHHQIKQAWQSQSPKAAPKARTEHHRSHQEVDVRRSTEEDDEWEGIDDGVEVHVHRLDGKPVNPKLREEELEDDTTIQETPPPPDERNGNADQ